MKEPKLIFLFGFPRSGTTYLQSILATHPEIASSPETHFFSRITRCIPDGKLLNDQELKKIKRALKSFSHIDLETSELEPGKLTKKQIFDRLANHFAHPKSCYLEKTPAHAIYANKIHRLYPDAHFIFIDRNPFHSFSSFKTKLKEYRSSLNFLVFYWKSMQVNMRRFRGKLLKIKYEDLREDPINTIKLIADFLKIESGTFYPDKAFQISSQFRTQDEQWKEANEEVDYQASTEALADADVRKIKYVLRKELDDLNYNFSPTSKQRWTVQNALLKIAVSLLAPHYLILEKARNCFFKNPR